MKSRIEIDKDLIRLFQRSRHRWLQEQKASTMAKNLVDLEKLEAELDVIAKEKNPREIRYLQFHIERCYWLCSSKTTFQEYQEAFGEQSEEQFQQHQRELAYLWLRRILSERDRTTDLTLSFYLDEIAEYGFLRENMVSDIIFRDKELSTFFSGSQGEIDFAGKIHLRQVIEWFLTRRYDLTTASRLVGHYYKETRSTQFFLKWSRYMWTILAFAVGLIVLFASRDDIAFVTFKELSLVWRPVAGAAAVILIYAGLLGALIDLVFFPLKGVLLTPRLVASLIIGYLPLVLARDVWNFAFSRSWPELFVMEALMLILSASYLVYEVYKTIGPPAPRSAGGGRQKGVALRRGGGLFIRSLFFSAGIDYLLMDWFGAFFRKGFLANSNDAEVSIVFCGLLGRIPLKPYSLFFATAMMLGVILQMIWEEKPITEPI